MCSTGARAVAFLPDPRLLPRGQPPYFPEDWQPKSRGKNGKWLGKLYGKSRSPTSVPSRTGSGPWTNEQLQEAVPVMNRKIESQVQGLKILQAIQSIRENEKWWRERTSDIDWGHVTLAELDQKFPRTFHCTQYNRTCEYTGVCFNREENGLEKPTDLTGMVPRTPHHPQEGSFDD